MRSEAKLSEYINRSKSLNHSKLKHKIRLAILGSFTLNGLKETLYVKCAENNISCSSYVSGYNQYNQDILYPQSELYKFRPDICFLILDTRSIFTNLYYLPYSVSGAERRHYVEDKVNELVELAKSFVSTTTSKLIISNLCVPTYSAYGICETKTEYSFRDMVIDLNNKLNAAFIHEPSLYVYDFNAFVAKHGEVNVFDYRQFFFGDIKVSLDYIPHVAEDLMGYIKPVLGINRKCIVLDLDNTLWGGIVGEDGFEGIELGPKTPGNAFVEFQRHLLSLYQRGIILAINSRNNPEEAMKVIREHPYMVLRGENFASMRINWNDKISNIKDIAEELNIGLDSLVYVDDDPINREIMGKALPEVLTINLPKDPSLYAPVLMNLNDLNVLSVTEDDKRRGTMYVEQRKREEFKRQVSNIEDFLSELDIRIRIRKADEFTIPRISQLILKTNQFNLTSRRYQEEDIRKFAHDEQSMLVGCAQIEDKFGDNGVTGAFIVKKVSPSEWYIDTFLLSCRVMGRGVEDAIMGFILEEAKKEGAKKIKGEYISTAKSKPCEAFLPNYGFKREGDHWVYFTDNDIKMPKHLKLMVEAQ